MSDQHCVQVRVPADPIFARSVRMMAANLAVVAEFSVDDVEDIRMAAQEGFVYAVATEPEAIDVTFTMTSDSIAMEFALGAREHDKDDLATSYAGLIISAVADTYGVTEDGSTLVITKQAGGC